MAAALFRHALDAQDEPLKSLTVSSAGISAYPGQPANANSIEALRKVGIDLGDHQSRPIDQPLAERALAYFGMTDSHIAMINLQLDPPPENAFLMRQFIENNEDLQIPDPFGLSLEHYEAARDSMVEAIPSLVEAVRILYEREQERNAQDREVPAEE